MGSPSAIESGNGSGTPCGYNSIPLTERLHLVKRSVHNPAGMYVSTNGCRGSLSFFFFLTPFLFKKIKCDLHLVILFANSEKVMVCERP